MRKIITLIALAICMSANSQFITSDKYSEVTTTSVDQNTHPYVDLGMRDTEGHPIYWAVYNLGVTITDYESLVYNDLKDGFIPENVGKLYCWGASDEAPYYKSTEGDLVGQEDTATKMWGEGWRMPTLAEFNELNNRNEFKWTYRYNCLNSEKQYYGVSGYYVTSLKEGFEGQQIFLPNRYVDGISSPASRSHYWTSTCSPTDIGQAYLIGMTNSTPSPYASIKPQNRSTSAYVRAVFVDYYTTDIANVKEKNKSTKVLKSVSENRLIILKNGKKYSVDGKQL
jgi:hypothetical protein